MNLEWELPLNKKSPSITGRQSLSMALFCADWELSPPGKLYVRLLLASEPHTLSHFFFISAEAFVWVFRSQVCSLEV